MCNMACTCCQLLSAFLVFWLAYDLSGRFEKDTSMINVFVAMNVGVILYCIVQLCARSR